jgi:hypothetical protein
VYAGDIDAFIGDQALIFDDIRDVLDQQFARLGALERAILLWLAIEREPLSEAQLWSLLMRTTTKRNLLEALRSLLRRSLLEQYGSAFGLQNVITEYLTDYLVAQVCHEFETEAPLLLHNYPLLTTHAKEYVRQSQRRIILQPIIERLTGTLGRLGVQARFDRMLETMRRDSPIQPSFLAGSILNLFLQIGHDLRGYDFSHLSVWQADLRGADLPAVDFRHADLRGSVFTDYVGAAMAVAFSPDGQLLAVGADNGAIYLFRVADRQLVGVCHGHQGYMGGLAFSPDGLRLVSGSDDWTLRIWDVASRQTLRVLVGHNGGISAVTFHPNGVLVASSGIDQTARIWDTATGALLHVLTGHAGMIQHLAFNPDGTLLATASHDQSVRIWDWQQERVAAVLNGHRGAVVTVVFCPHPILWGEQERLLLISGSHDQSVRIWDWQ